MGQSMNFVRRLDGGHFLSFKSRFSNCSINRSMGVGNECKCYLNISKTMPGRLKNPMALGVNTTIVPDLP